MAGLSSLRTEVSPLVRRFLGIGAIRSYGCAAQVQYDYDYSEEEENTASYQDQRRCSTPMVDSEGSVSERGVQWVVIGDPGAKKHMYAERLSKLLEVPHISMGSLVRQELSPLSSLYKQIANAVNHGKLVPEDIIFGLLTKRLEEGYRRGETGFILDGIPRTRLQAEILDQIADVDLVVNLICTEEQHLVKKHLRNGSASPFRELNLHNLPKSPISDKNGHWNEKLHFYSEQSKPLEDYYRKQQKMLDFQVEGQPAETWRGLLAALHLEHVDATHKLIT